MLLSVGESTGCARRRDDLALGGYMTSFTPSRAEERESDESEGRERSVRVR